MSAKSWRVLRYNQPKFAKSIAVLNRHAAPDPARAAAVSDIIAAVRHEGDAALVRYAKKWDKVDLTPASLLLPSRKIQASDAVREAVDYALHNIRDFSKLRKPRSWSRVNREGAKVGEKFDPLERIGVYVPGGTAPLVSTALMTVGLAKEARVREIVVTTPGPVDERLRYALVTDVAIAALAYGTEMIARVQKIFGPGNAWVIEAKRQVVGAVAIDQLPGPSEIAIVADDSAHAAFVAADLLAQAEHGSGTQVLFLTASAKLLAEVEAQLAKQWPTLSRGKHLAEVLENGCTLILVEDVGEAIGIVEDFAPEHLTLVIKDARQWSETI
jgi:histidinol dehydrogenase